MSFWKEFYQWTSDKTWLGYYSEYKDWLRGSAFGRIIDRFIRVAVIAAIGVFVANYTGGQEFLPVLKTSLVSGFVAAFDKVKNEWLVKLREADSGFSTT